MVNLLLTFRGCENTSPEASKGHRSTEDRSQGAQGLDELYAFTQYVFCQSKGHELESHFFKYGNVIGSDSGSIEIASL